MVKSLPAMQEAWVLSMGGEDPLEKDMATHSSILAWELPWTEEPGRLQSMGFSSLLPALVRVSDKVGRISNIRAGAVLSFMGDAQGKQQLIWCPSLRD